MRLGCAIVRTLQMCLMAYSKCISKCSNMLHRQDLRMLDISLHSLPHFKSRPNLQLTIKFPPSSVCHSFSGSYRTSVFFWFERYSRKLLFPLAILPSTAIYKHKCVHTYRQYQPPQTFFMQTNSDLSSLRIWHISTTTTKNSSSQHPVRQL